MTTPHHFSARAVVYNVPLARLTGQPLGFQFGLMPNHVLSSHNFEHLIELHYFILF